ncbi:MAG: hypothetical protein JXA72_12285 [Bacteroidales bacterium]|nr:hypothetical protein [Bacteroidales bacterium]
MKTKISCLVLALMAATMLYQCEKEKQTDTTLTGKLVKTSECKDFLKSALVVETIADTLSCLQYQYDAENHKLAVKHVNTGFNCCPDELYCAFSLISDTIVIKESEKSALCHCNCLYDMDIEITGVDARKYQVKVVEPYAVNMDKLIFEVDLVQEPEGSFCVTRKTYPWGVSMW